VKGKLLFFFFFFTFFSSCLNSIIITQQVHFNHHYEIESTNFGLKSENDAQMYNSEEWVPIERTFTPNFYRSPTIDQSSSKVVEYDCEKRVESINNSSNLEVNPNSAQIEPFEGLLDNHDLYNEDPRLSYIFPPDDRELVTDTTTYPWRTICKLFITAADGEKFTGSGTIIDNFHVLTCGHCVYIHEAGGWAASIQVVPAMNGTYRPYLSSYVTHMRTYTGWTESEMVEHDWAVLTLDRSIGLFTGWMGRKTDDPSSSIYTGILHTAGYPGDLDYGEYIYQTSDYGDRADEYNHWFWLDAAEGQSGSPVWMDDGSNRYILSILAYGYEDGSDTNFGTRLNTNKFNDINTWLSQDASSPPNDKAELIGVAEFTTISKTEVTAGQSNFQISFEVENTGTKTATNFNVSFYASEDLFITTPGYLIGTASIQTLDPFDYAITSWEGTFPNSIPSGTYYVGWIIDEENTVDEHNKNNNFGFLNYETITVQHSFNTPFNPTGLIILTSVVGLAVVILASLIRSTLRSIPDLDFKYDYSKFFEG
jgi:V8-like Glu-specific endopeptidase